MLFRKDERKHLGLFYLHSVLESTFAVVWIYWVVYLLDQGFSYSIIGLALAVNGASMAVLEVPTGALADAVSRKLSVIAGLCGFAFILFLIPFIKSPLVLTVVFAVWGFPIALISGAAEAWVVDNLRAENREDLIKEFYVKISSITNLGSILAALLSGLIVQFLGMDALWYTYGAALLASVSILVMQKEHFERKEAHFLRSLNETYTNIREGAHFTIREKNVMYIMIATFFFFVGSELINICSKPFLEIIGVPREYFGYLSAVGFALCVGMPFLARHLADLFNREEHYLSLHALVFGVVTASVVLIKTPEIAAILFVVIMLRYTTMGPVLGPFFQGFLPRKLRATLGSFRNMVISIAFLVGDFIISVFADVTGPQIMVAMGGAVILPSIIFYLGVRSK
ncbi:MAG: hypothetical protein AYK18_11835 [Theionarchaea archaeon DG-70]|nr:MAG: hypothetical protein AYK18_11835 [Theionarchaea archaeon DG-70]